MLCRLSEAIVQSSPRTQAGCEIEIFRLRLAQGHIDTLPNLPQLSFCEWMSSEVGNEPIKFGVGDHRKSASLEIRVLGLEPCPCPAAHISRANSLRDDALEAHPARMTKDGGAVAGDRLAQLDVHSHGLAVAG